MDPNFRPQNLTSPDHSQFLLTLLNIDAGSAWADHDDGPLRRPPLRRSESEDWRSDSLRGKGDGAEDIINGLKEWRVSGHRGGADFWKGKSSEYCLLVIYLLTLTP